MVERPSAVRDHILILLFGVLVEILSVFWAHFSENGLAGKTAACTMIANLINLYCLKEALNDIWERGSFIAGLTLGAYCAVRVKKWIKEQRGSTCPKNKSTIPT